MDTADTANTAPGQLFVWRDELKSDRFYSDGGGFGANADRLASAWASWPSPLRDLSLSECVHCKSRFEIRIETPNIHKVQYSFRCPFCGFSWS